jgi:EAL domain-containing protein (putative c-di-GMP-specific phosphodiesterase class I)
VSYERTSAGSLRPARAETAEGSLASELEVLAAGLSALSRGPAVRAFTADLCGATLAEPRARRELLDALSAAGPLRERWGFEVGEVTALAFPEATLQFSRELVELGSSLVIDGFVGGWPSALAEMCLAGLKLDASIVSGLPDDLDALASLRCAVSAAAGLRFPLQATRLVHGRARETLVASGISVGQGPWSSPLRVLA